MRHHLRPVVRSGSLTLRLLTLLALVAALVTATSTAAHACKCAEMTPAQAVGNAKAVFTGTVTAARVSDSRPVGSRAVYTFRADHVYKGTPAAEFTVATNVESAACGYAFTQGTRYLVFATSSNGIVSGTGLSSGSCAGNRPVAQGTGPLRPTEERPPGQAGPAGAVDAELVAALGRPTKVSAMSPHRVQARPAQATATSLDWRWTVTGVAVLALVLIAGLALIARRRRAARDV
ncbi:hypothetical protein ABGB18_01870 [Nonomuraea sp. B12E4]|uniref:hypothetical protein n=1 Tax=Nonomuraea sp. B12E4 TaxID=3153564 RepID=UPI00325EFF69